MPPQKTGQILTSQILLQHEMLSKFCLMTFLLMAAPMDHFS